MRELVPISEGEMVLTFIRGEIASPRKSASRYREFIRQNSLDRAQLVENADLADLNANEQRLQLLRYVRGYPDSYLFCNFPISTKWRRAVLEPADFPRLKYIRGDDNWNKLSNDTRRVSEGARNLDRILITTGEINGQIRELAKVLQNGPIGELIVVEDGRHTDLVVLDGMHRATAYLYGGTTTAIPTLIGSSLEMCRWARF
jgi:hypothetical protein